MVGVGPGRTPRPGSDLGAGLRRPRRWIGSASRTDGCPPGRSSRRAPLSSGVSGSGSDGGARRAGFCRRRLFGSLGSVGGLRRLGGRRLGGRRRFGVRRLRLGALRRAGVRLRSASADGASAAGGSSAAGGASSAWLVGRWLGSLAHPSRPQPSALRPPAPPQPAVRRPALPRPGSSARRQRLGLGAGAAPGLGRLGLGRAAGKTGRPRGTAARWGHLDADQGGDLGHGRGDTLHHRPQVVGDDGGRGRGRDDGVHGGEGQRLHDRGPAVARRVRHQRGRRRLVEPAWPAHSGTAPRPSEDGTTAATPARRGPHPAPP